MRKLTELFRRTAPPAAGPAPAPSPTPSPTAAPSAPAGAERADALIAQGHALEDAGRLAEALARYRDAVAAAPGHARAHLNLGNGLLASGDAAGALAAYTQAASLRADYAPAHFNAGNAHARLGDIRVALASYEEAVRCDPAFADAWIALGNAQDEIGASQEAIASYQRALVLQPQHAAVLANLAEVQRRIGALDAAEASARRALALAPQLAQAELALGRVLQDRGHDVEALARFRRAQAHDDSVASLVEAYRAATRLCDWRQRADDEAALVRLAQAGAPDLPPFTLLNVPTETMTPALQRSAAQRFAQATLAGPLRLARTRWPRAASAAPRVTIGYLSADFHEHATMHLLRGVLAHHDRERFRICAYSYGATRDAVTEEARAHCEVFRDVAGLSDAQAAECIAQDGVDLLVDLKGFTQGARLGIVARRPAPILVSWLGYPGTLGEPGLADWVIGDAVVTPPGHAGDFSEALALMPHCYQPNDAAKAIAPPPTRAQAGLPADAFVFCSFNRPYKLSPAIDDLWCRLLREVPRSVLWLLPASAATVANLQREAAARGVDPARLVFAPTLPLSDHLARLSLADLALDTYPYTSHTTGSDALWAGVPLVTRLGASFASRVAASLLHAVGLPELVTSDDDAYVALANSLALDPPRLAALRAKLAANRHTAPLFDTLRFTRDLETLYLRIRDAQARGERGPVTT